jgi:hypothetical protein
MAKWTPFPHAGQFRLDAAQLKKQWARLHTGDAEPLPKDPPCCRPGCISTTASSRRHPKSAWQQAARASPQPTRRRRFTPTTSRRRKRRVWSCSCRWPNRPQATGRPTRRTPTPGTGMPTHWAATARASAWPRRWPRGWAARFVSRWKKPSPSRPAHADAHIALGAFHAEVIDKVGALIGGMTYGAKKDKASTVPGGTAPQPGSAIAMIEYANALVMLEGERKKMKRSHGAVRTAPPPARRWTPWSTSTWIMAQAELED